MVGAQWKELTDEQKKPYIEMSKKDMADRATAAATGATQGSNLVEEKKKAAPAKKAPKPAVQPSGLTSSSSFSDQK